MSTTTDRAREARRLRDRGMSQREIGARLGVSRSRVQQILLGEASGDRLHEELIATSPLPLLVRHERVLVERIRRDLRYLRATREEIVCRRDDEILGLTLAPGDDGTTMPSCSRPTRAPRSPAAR